MGDLSDLLFKVDRIERVAAVLGGDAATRDLLLVRDSISAFPDDGIAVARLLRQRYEGAKLAGELETNLSFLRYGYDSTDAAAAERLKREEWHGHLQMTAEGQERQGRLRQRLDAGICGP